MNKNHSNAAVQILPTFIVDDLVGRAFDGDRAALDELARLLHARLAHEARLHLGDLEHEADDIAQDVFVAILEGRVRLPPANEAHGGVAHLFRMARVFAQQHVQIVRRSRDLE